MGAACDVRKPETLQGVASLPLFNGGSRQDHHRHGTRSIVGSGADGDAWPPFRGAAAHRRDRTDRISHGRRPVRDAGNSPDAHSCLRCHAGRHGFCRQFKHAGHGGCRPACLFVQSADRPTTGHPDQPCGPVNPDGAPFRCARFDQLYHSAGRARALHGVRVHADTCLSRRRMQRR
jgi:hypothetical protein